MVGQDGYQSFPNPTLKQFIARFETDFLRHRSSHLFKRIARRGAAVFLISRVTAAGELSISP
jgi:hypothetical protein